MSHLHYPYYPTHTVIMCCTIAAANTVCRNTPIIKTGIGKGVRYHVQTPHPSPPLHFNSLPLSSVSVDFKSHSVHNLPRMISLLCFSVTLFMVGTIPSRRPSYLPLFSSFTTGTMRLRCDYGLATFYTPVLTKVWRRSCDNVPRSTWHSYKPLHIINWTNYCSLFHWMRLHP